MSSFADVPTCTPQPNETDGLWTAIVLAAEVFRYAVTGAADALDTALSLYGGMRLLNIITGVPGLMARTVLAPNETHPGGPDWYNSTVPGYEGWVWQHNTSSDDVTGHMFGLPIFAKVMNQSLLETQEAAQIVHDIATYIVEHDFELVDLDGQHTQWGVWNPAIINTDRFWSDERFVSS